jgi:hypothetical protein
MDGGTLACGPDSYSGSFNRVRLGVAKTKGKHRVVTMQSAQVKKVLRPLHNALYSHITSYGWCVRGDVTKEDFVAVREGLKDDEQIISGDYSNATNEIYLPVVQSLVEVIAEDPDLTDVEREVLLGSFEDIEFKSSVCKVAEHYPIRRGSMMGNLLSFPLLCLLNRACFDVVVDTLCPSERVERKGRFNGDDCMFRGNQEFYDTWVYVTGLFGLVVNKEKTGRSRSWGCLNSTWYHYGRGSFVARPVLSFLRLDPTKPGPILRQVLSGISSFRRSVQLWIVNSLMRYEISLRGVESDLGFLTPWWRAVLLKRRWFRCALSWGGALTSKTGDDRQGPVVVGPVPVRAAWKFVAEAHGRLEKERVEFWTGRRVRAVREKLDRREWKLRRTSSPPLKGVRYRFGGLRWKFVWPKELLEFFQDEFPELLMGSCMWKWLDDNPLLTVRRDWYTEVPATRYPPPLPMLRGCVRADGGVWV